MNCEPNKNNGYDVKTQKAGTDRGVRKDTCSDCSSESGYEDEWGEFFEDFDDLIAMQIIHDNADW